MLVRSTMKKHTKTILPKLPAGSFRMRFYILSVHRINDGKTSLTKWSLLRKECVGSDYGSNENRLPQDYTESYCSGVIEDFILVLFIDDFSGSRHELSCRRLHERFQKGL
jgi:hypothetical protein